jgi:hypothetical protein
VNPAGGHKCNYNRSGKYCTLTGTMTSAPKPSETTDWYCQHHHNFDENPKAAAEAFQAILSRKITEKRGSWHDDVMDEKLAELRISDPIIFTNGTREEVAEVNLSLMRQMRTFGVNLPYDQNAKHSEKGFSDDSVLDDVKPITQEAIDAVDVSKFVNTKTQEGKDE